MSLRTLALVAGLTLCGIATAEPQGAASEGPPPAAAFGRLPAIEDLAISPSGKYIALLESTDEATVLDVIEVDTAKSVRRMNLGGVKARQVEWGGETHALATVGFTRNYAELHRKVEWTRVVSLDITNGSQRWLLPGPDQGDNNSHTIWGRIPGDPNGVLMDAFDFYATAYTPSTGTHLGSNTPVADAFKLVLHRVDVATGATSNYSVGERFTRDWQLGANGPPVARMDLDTRTERFSIYAARGSGWRQILLLDHQIDEPLAFAGLNPTDGAPLLIDFRSEHSALERLDLTSGALTPMAFAEAPGPVNATRTDPYTGKVVALDADLGLSQKTYWIDPALAKVHARISKALANAVVSLIGWNTDRSRILVSAGGPNAPTKYYLFKPAAGTLDTVDEAYPELAQAKLGQKEPITYKARDGVDIPAYVTWPAGATRKNLPMVLLPHGGPEARDTANFDWLAQFFATRGYVVLQPQFRGSTGFGKAWAEAGHKQWGRRMQDDLSDGVAYLTGAGAVDPKRVCIVGASYGGYAALAGATLTPNLYACAVAVAGVSDLSAMIGQVKARTAASGDPGAVKYWADQIGSVFDPAVHDASPINNIAAARAPILLIHGRDDTVVPYSQSSNMADGLRRAGKDVTLVPLDGEDHWLSVAKTRTQMLQAIEPFLAKALAR